MSHELKPLINLTLHPQGDREVELAAAAGFALSRQAEGVEVAPGAASFPTAAAELASRLEQCAAGQNAVLTGGHTGLWIAAVSRLISERCDVPAIFAFDTWRARDQSGKFVFQPVGLLLITPERRRGPRYDSLR